jgi:cytochrome b561
MKQNPSRHHPALVSLHWLLALLIMLAMGMGTFVLKEIPNASPHKLGALQSHMIMGFAIGDRLLSRMWFGQR